MSRTSVSATVVAALLLATTFGGSAQAKVERTEHVNYYDVNGKHIDAIMASLDRLGPPDDTGERFHARTDARIDWNFSVHNGADGCTISGITTKVSITVIMPRLVSTDSELQTEFGDYTARLMHHETGHVENARKTAAEIDDALAALAPAASCKEMKALANATGHRLFDAGAKRDVTYDRVTDHGRLQGAHFP